MVVGRNVLLNVCGDDAASDVAAADNDDESDDCRLQLPVVHVLLEHYANTDATANGSITALGLALLAGCAATSYRRAPNIVEPRRTFVAPCASHAVQSVSMWTQRLQAGSLAVANVLLQQILIVHSLTPLSGYARKAGALMGMGHYK